MLGFDGKERPLTPELARPLLEAGSEDVWEGAGDCSFRVPRQCWTWRLKQLANTVWLHALHATSSGSLEPSDLQPWCSIPHSPAGLPQSADMRARLSRQSDCLSCRVYALKGS